MTESELLELLRPPEKKLEDALRRIAELEAAVLAAKVLLEPTTDSTEHAWQVLDTAYHAKR